MDNKPGRKFGAILTLISIGTMAYVFADIFHEAIGHGVTSLVLGNRITLLTSVYFRSEPHSFITDAFGPIFNLIAGLIIWTVFKQVDVSNLPIRLLLILTMAFNFFWFSWMCMYGGVTNKGDFAFYFSGQSELLIWRIFLTILGVVSYYVTFKLTAKRAEFKTSSAGITARQLFSIPWLSAGISALIAVSFYRPLLFDNFYEAFVFPMFLPILFLSRQVRSEELLGERYPFRVQWSLTLAGLAIFIVFCLTMGAGLKA